MSDSGKRLIEGAQEALAIAKGEKPAAAIWHNGHRYLSEAALSQAPVAENERLRMALEYIISMEPLRSASNDMADYARAALSKEGKE